MSHLTLAKLSQALNAVLEQPVQFDTMMTSYNVYDNYWKYLAPGLWRDYWREWRVFRSLCESGLILRGRL